jgi:hypothetical protein
MVRPDRNLTGKSDCSRDHIVAGVDNDEKKIETNHVRCTKLDHVCTIQPYLKPTNCSSGRLAMPTPYGTLLPCSKPVLASYWSRHRKSSQELAFTGRRSYESCVQAQSNKRDIAGPGPRSYPSTLTPNNFLHARRTHTTREDASRFAEAQFPLTRLLSRHVSQDPVGTFILIPIYGPRVCLLRAVIAFQFVRSIDMKGIFAPISGQNVYIIQSLPGGLLACNIPRTWSTATVEVIASRVRRRTNLKFRFVILDVQLCPATV